MKLFEIESRVDALAQKIGAPPHILPTYGYSEQNARPHVEASQWAYYYVVAQSGQEVSRYTTLEIDQLLYKIFGDVTFALSIPYAEQHRSESQDIRRYFFQRQVELLHQLSPEWGGRMAWEQAETLKQAPFDDLGSVRFALWKSLREQGYTVAQANKMAHETYPYPNKPGG